MPLNYVGYWEKNNGYAVPKDLSLYVEEPIEIKDIDMPGKSIPYGVMWGLLSRFRYMCLLSNVLDNKNVPVVRSKKCFDRMLELGCDYGHTWTCFDAFAKEIHGIEIGNFALTGAALGRKIIKADFDDGLPYPDSYFDLVTSAHTLEHTRNPSRLVDEIYRVTKYGGWSAHVMPCLTTGWREPANNFHNSEFNSEDWLQAFSSKGFIIIRHFWMWATNQEDWSIIARKVYR